MKIKRTVILGGTGTLGRGLVRLITKETPDAEILIVSRDEHKHAVMKRHYPSVKFKIADIKDPESLFDVFRPDDTVFHVAALKHVDLMEENPSECFKTNVIGTQNAAKYAIASGVKHFVFSSTDKAIDPINVYGYSKAIAEKMLLSMNQLNKTSFSVYRWGNVIGSQGSIIPKFADDLISGKPISLTDLKMTRFWLPLDWAVNFMVTTFFRASKDAAMVLPGMKAAPVIDIVECLAEMLNVKKYEIQTVGLRPGEKIHESMFSVHSGEFMDSQTAPQYSRDELKELLTPVVDGARYSRI